MSRYATDPFEEVLEAARWAPSGDNTQPWCVERKTGLSFLIHLRREQQNPYEYRGAEPVLLSAGMFLESLAIAASAEGMSLRWSLPQPEGWIVEAELVPTVGLKPNPLLPLLPIRSVVRGPMGARSLTGDDKRALEAAVAPDLVVTWHETLVDRCRIAGLGRRATDIRLRAPETFAVHQRVIDWKGGDSAEGIPAEAIGIDPATRRVMRWAMRTRARTRWVNRLLGTSATSAQLDLLPAIRSSAIFSVKTTASDGLGGHESKLKAGMALQRFWLTATRSGLGLQPALATLIFADLGSTGERFTSDLGLLRKAKSLAAAFTGLIGPPADIVFLGRLGRLRSEPPRARSVRRSVADLLSGPANMA